MKQPSSRPFALLLPTLVLLAAAPARAVDNSTHIVGLGAEAAFTSAGAEPMISAKFPIIPRLELSVLFGMEIGKALAAFDPGAKVDFVLIPEKHMNLYMAAAIGFDVRTTSGFNSFLYRLGPGMELFFSDFPNLGVSLEFGLSGDITGPHPDKGTPATNLSTDLLSGFGTAGLHYYF